MVLGVIMALLLAATGPVPGCAPIEGSELILADPKIDYVIFGENHGTNESPALFGDLVCQAAMRGPVVVALEIQLADQPIFDTYLASDGDAAARAGLLASSLFSDAMKDGRSSLAMLALVERLRRLFQAKQILGVVATLDPAAYVPGDQTPHDRAIAANWTRALAAHPGARLLALIGDAHAVPGRVDFGQPFLAAASFLPREHTATLGGADTGGVTWNCMALDDCGPHAFGRGSQAWPRSIRRSPKTESSYHWDYLYAPGAPFTPSRPAS